ncbi:hypothetical protein KC349_g234 [Hortaea werneckii]|nr:hypothetical protein KC349_g234 [Hortaea werneckii]
MPKESKRKRKPTPLLFLLSQSMTLQTFVYPTDSRVDVSAPVDQSLGESKQKLLCQVNIKRVKFPGKEPIRDEVALVQTSWLPIHTSSCTGNFGLAERMKLAFRSDGRAAIFRMGSSICPSLSQHVLTMKESTMTVRHGKASDCQLTK